MIAKSRLDALTDGVFAFAMTLLVLDLRLPDSFNPATAADLWAGINNLGGQFLAYVISFGVLGLRWMTQVSRHQAVEQVSPGYALWLLVYLFFITCIPFSTMVVGRYDSLAPATWLYAANMTLSALATLRMSLLAEEEADQKTERRRRIGGSIVIIISAALSVAISFVDPSWAMLAYLLNVIPGFSRRRAEAG